MDLKHAHGGVLPKAHIGKIDELDDDEKEYNSSLLTGYRINYKTWR